MSATLERADRVGAICADFATTTNETVLSEPVDADTFPSFLSRRRVVSPKFVYLTLCAAGSEAPCSNAAACRDTNLRAGFLAFTWPLPRDILSYANDLIIKDKTRCISNI